MKQPGTESNPLRVAVIGAGPAGFYAAEHLLKQDDIVVEVDMFDRLPTPYGLVRGGVAPDHQKIKSVTRVYERTASGERFRYFGNVEFGVHVTLADLERHYHQIYFSTGAQTDRSLRIPGENLAGSHSATEFVAWYNGHPDFCDLSFDLSRERVAIIGVGNVALDVARILCRTPEELAKTDIADYALEALRSSRVREVYVLGRRGPAQAAFTPPELKELGELEAADVVVDLADVELDAASLKQLEETGDRTALKNVEILREFASRPLAGKPKRLIFKFMTSPVEIVSDEAGHVSALKTVRNELVASPDGRVQARPTGAPEVLPADLVFRSIGYQGVALPDLPFDERHGTIPNLEGRVLDASTRKPLKGLYVGGWIKRGPSGVIGTNKPDAVETVTRMLEDAMNGRTLSPNAPGAEAAEQLLRERQPDLFTFDDWRRLDAYETQKGKPLGRPRVKLIRIEEMISARNNTDQKAENHSSPPRSNAEANSKRRISATLSSPFLPGSLPPGAHPRDLSQRY